MRNLVMLLFVLSTTFALASCRCDSGIGSDQTPPPLVTAPDPPPADGPMMWCMACAKAGFTACKRVEGRDGEDAVRRRAELAACKDVAIADDQCTGDVLSNVKCGTSP
jgi:hypothetical protein